MKLDGTWIARYAIRRPRFINDASGEDKAATVIFKDGKISGNDIFGFEYSGEFSLDGQAVKALVIATPNKPGAESILCDVNGRRLTEKYHVSLEGYFGSANRFSMTGRLIENRAQEVVINFTREE
ncbi:MAG TPA: hypothetical protein VJ302_35025 [Blastocatellia bacterium]|nr:hypothetical protein [Blastocatellia bacterium]